MIEGSNKYQYYVRLGKRYSSPNVADVRKYASPPFFLHRANSLVLTNLSEQEKTAKEIAAAEELLSETLSRLTRLRRQQQTLCDRGAEVFRCGMDRLEMEEEPDSPALIPEEQLLTG